MGKTFVIGCTHFGHEAIIKHSDRPFANAKEMDEHMIMLWNQRVRHGDDVIHFGDFSFKDYREYLPKLNGNLFLIKGNHDKENGVCTDQRWIWVKDYFEMKRQNGSTLILSHFPIHSWNGMFRGVKHLHAHTHGHLPSYDQRIDVSMDGFGGNWGYGPINLDELLLNSEQLPEWEVPETPERHIQKINVKLLV